MERRRLLAISYTCSPSRGSEPGAAWGTLLALAEQADVTVVTSPYFAEEVRAWYKAHPDQGLHFVVVPHPSYGPLIDGITRWHRQADFAKYLGWLRSAGARSRQLVQGGEYDAAIHVAFGSYWTPSPVTDLGLPSVWGPVGGATTTPLRLWPVLGWRGVLGEIEKRIAVAAAARLPATRATWQRATVRVAEAPATQRVLSRDGAAVPKLQRAVLSTVPEVARPPARDPVVVFPSSLQGRKGPRLALRALAAGPAHLRLVFAADGYERRPLERLARRLGVADRVEFRGWVSRDEMFDLFSRCTAAMFTGVREEGGCALAEAMLLGAPVVVLGVGGARMIAESTTDPDRVAIVEPRSVTRVVEDLASALARFASSPSARFDGHLDQHTTAAGLREVVERAIAAGAGR